MINDFGTFGHMRNMPWQWNSDIFSEISRGTWVAIAFAVLLLGLIGLALYIVRAYALMKLAAKNGEQNAFLAFIPFASEYLLGKVIREVKLGKTTVNYLEWIFLAATIIGFLGYASYVGLVFVLYIVFRLSCMYRLFVMTGERNYAVLYIVLCIFGLDFIPLLIIRNRVIDRSIQ